MRQHSWKCFVQIHVELILYILLDFSSADDFAGDYVKHKLVGRALLCIVDDNKF